MHELTSHERMSRFLNRQVVDRVPVSEGFWAEAIQKWTSQGHLAKDEDVLDHFGLDFRCGGWMNMVADLDFKDEIVEETEETKLVRSGNGAVLRWWKNNSGTPEHVDFLVKDFATWREHARGHLTNPDFLRRRIGWDSYRASKAKCREKNLFMCWGGLQVFECMHPLCGHENMLIGMALEPEWVKDMCDVYSDVILHCMEILFAEEGPPDAVFFYEDMGFKERPFMSPAMYRDIVQPAHKKTFDFCKSKGLPIIVHSCGFVEPLVGGLIEAGMDCLQAMEVKAGMDLVHLKKKFGDRIAFMGGMDVRTMVANDRKAIQAELDRKLPAAMAGGGYCLHSDHSIPGQVDYDTYKFFVDRGREMGTYK